ncbi:NADH-quinone oxidoreductase subunit NuoF [Lawsonibacter faecis]|uniref:NADH-quinone oxidoreductase subunit NuoF n=1 Tax=Lawsonibacter faecis TaxID=2763052 RepID=A0A8J6J3M7_9FIRM|nr:MULTISPECIES: NADH-quinone oxidoreductase subunit NuoF [Oscillospiraceae]MTQ95986.1 NADH-quinone oxidoreductase subunit NuoF [Pseudoflavonifractor sp. BIOML-A16]MTR04738.1 NADH-quinone oxidoreductase subunit NuoF [Pseudoflavonifractor sp. BIOML-A15]MTR31014.1 NADH-quinone oxidoreductase subunit NuoF [Pseudoflavonifractor sp. BIOML-A14]MTR71579.1 NADH-quinone oxidoreductase subunit NuoF [Pseudoflavonifractor sp. BIOML-A18]MTS62878.1 NADH-quinone oxidoreductase subunit NuoF [Pseudoflavonifrac
MHLKTREDLRAARVLYGKSLAAQEKKILVCAGTGCISSGSLDVYDRLRELMEERGIHCAVRLEEEPHEHEVGMKKSGCHGFCEMGPLVRIEPWGYLYTKVKVADCEEIVEKTILGGEHIERLAYHQNGKVFEKQDEIPFYQKQTRLVLEHCGHIDATSIEEYLGIGGYTALEKALFEMDGDAIIRTVTDSGLRGRGGGGFPAGKKWSQVKAQKTEEKYIVCNGDEGDPGAFMDRSIMEGDPHRLLEGMMIAGLACGAAEGYIYVRAEYPMAVERLRTAISQAEAWGLLGENVLGTGFSFKMHINRGAGAFVCGEGSALTASIEGKRGMPRVKPPRTVEHGLFDKPTVLNNVETFANVPRIIREGAEWFQSFGTAGSPGTKAFALTGNIENTGLIEVPMGTTLREIIFDIGGGIKDGKEFKAVQIGGPSGGCLIETNLDLPLDFDSLKKVGGMIGSGGLVVMDDSTCMVEVARFFMNFTQNESCGKCVPCREGTRRMLEIMERIVDGRGEEGDIETLLELSDMISNTALCGLGKTAAFPVLGTIRYFRDEYEAHIREKRCPAGQCQKLKRIWIEADECKGCSKCARNCPVNAITGKVKEPFTIDANKCIKCGACVEACPFHAVKEG